MFRPGPAVNLPKPEQREAGRGGLTKGRSGRRERGGKERDVKGAEGPEKARVSGRAEEAGWGQAEVPTWPSALFTSSPRVRESQ